jgi:hypothetical protein
MTQYPAWASMPPKQKFEFLYEWIANLDQAVKTLREDNQLLHERLRQAEAKAAGIASQPKP